MRKGGPWLILAGGCGFAAVGVGAFGAHGLDKILSPYGVDLWKTATHYLMFHVGALAVTGLLARSWDSRLLNLSGAAFLAGIVLFSGSLYLLALTGETWLGLVTPLGGLSFLAGWAMLVAAVYHSP